MWELIEHKSRAETGEYELTSDRLRVPGGWIVRTIITRIEATSVHQVFVPDPDDQWKL